MRLLYLILLPALTAALQIPDFSSFLSAFSLENYFLPNATAPPAHDLLKRQFSNTCPKDFNNCASLGAPGLCCATGAVCSADAAGHVACCPIGAACSGTIGGVITQGTVNSVGSLVDATSTVAGGTLTTATTSSFVYAGQTTTTTGGLVMASTPTATSQTAGLYNPSTSGQGFVIDGTSTVATPGAAVRGVQVPMVARAVIRMLEYLPI